jgi:nucleotide-binding universal stress UspA family protein
MTAFRTLLVPHDFSADSAAALDVAIELAKELGAAVHLVHAYHTPIEMFSPYGVALPTSVVPEIRQGAERRLGEELEKIRSAGLSGEAQVREGLAPDAIVEAARSLGVDLIVIGTRGRTGLSHALLGSVAERTLRTAPCPVLTVKAAGAPPRAQAADPSH